MMFSGIYTSGFYCTIRDLLHQRVSLESWSAPIHAERSLRNRSVLDQRWREPIAREQHYRNVAAVAS